MDNLLNEIKHLTQQGLEKSIISRDENYKEIFLQIMLKSETAIEKFSQLSASQKSIYEKLNSSVRTHDRIDEARKSNMYLIAYCFSRFEHTSLFLQYIFLHSIYCFFSISLYNYKYTFLFHLQI